jgi:membrane protein implicated in regulation of membrane protease activity
MNCLAMILGVIAAFTSVFGPKWFLLISAISAFAGGYIIGGYLESSPNKWQLRIIIGIILSLFAIWAGLWTRYYRRKGREKLRRGYRQLKNIMVNEARERDS